MRFPEETIQVAAAGEGFSDADPDPNAADSAPAQGARRNWDLIRRRGKAKQVVRQAWGYAIHDFWSDSDEFHSDGARKRFTRF